MRNVGYDDLTKTLVTKKEKRKKKKAKLSGCNFTRLEGVCATFHDQNFKQNVRRKNIFAYILRVTKAGAQTLNCLSLMSWLLVSLTNASFISDVLLLS